MKTSRWLSIQTLLWIAIVFALAISAHANVTLPALLADHMVLQRGLPVHVWGMAAPHEAVAVTFRGETKSGTADDLGRWSVYLSPGDAGGPFPLIVKATNMITLNDILVGDVWVASGQSNMEFPMTELVNAAAEIAAAQYPKIRIFQVEHKPADYPQEISNPRPGLRARRRRLRSRPPSPIFSRGIFSRRSMSPSRWSKRSGEVLQQNRGLVCLRSRPTLH